MHGVSFNTGKYYSSMGTSYQFDDCLQTPIYKYLFNLIYVSTVAEGSLVKGLDICHQLAW